MFEIEIAIAIKNRLVRVDVGEFLRPQLCL
jgi:hypothetical protein